MQGKPHWQSRFSSLEQESKSEAVLPPLAPFWLLPSSEHEVGPLYYAQASCASLHGSPTRSPWPLATQSSLLLSPPPCSLPVHLSLRKLRGTWGIDWEAHTNGARARAPFLSAHFNLPACACRHGTFLVGMLGASGSRCWRHTDYALTTHATYIKLTTLCAALRGYLSLLSLLILSCSEQN